MSLSETICSASFTNTIILYWRSQCKLQCIVHRHNHPVLALTVQATVFTVHTHYEKLTTLLAASVDVVEWLEDDDVGQSSSRLIVSKCPPFAASINIVDPSCTTDRFNQHSTAQHSTEHKPAVSNLPVHSIYTTQHTFITAKIINYYYNNVLYSDSMIINDRLLNMEKARPGLCNMNI